MAEGLIALLPEEASIETRAAVHRVCEVLESVGLALDKRKARSSRNTTGG